MNEPHTYEFNGGIFLIYVYMYCTHVQCTRTRTMYGQYTRDLKTHVDLNILYSVIQNFSVWSCFATCSEHRYSEYFQKNTKTIARKGRLTAVT